MSDEVHGPPPGGADRKAICPQERPIFRQPPLAAPAADPQTWAAEPGREPHLAELFPQA